MASLQELIATTATRQRGLELALLAHAMLDRSLLLERHRPKISAACRQVLEAIEFYDAGVPFSPELLALVHFDEPIDALAPALELAAAACQVTAADLGAVMSRESLLLTLGAAKLEKRRRTRADQILEIATATTATTPATAEASAA